MELQELGRINILVGPNNSGKTSVLEALALLCDPLYPYEWLSLVGRRDFGGLDENRIQSLQWCCQQEGFLIDPSALVEAECEMQSVGTFPLRQLTVHYKDIVGEPSTEELEKLSRYSRVQEKRMKRALDRGWRGAEIVHFVQFDSWPTQQTFFGPGYSTKPVAMRIWEGLPIHRLAAPDRPRVESETLTPYSYQINRSNSLAMTVEA
jgi:energy-coupling factor transporter ATP-binding protein EcfA2